MLENELDKINEKTPENAEIKLPVSLAGLGKRSLAAVLDIAILISLAFALMVYVIQPIYRKHTNINDIVAQQETLKLDSHLFYEDAETHRIKSVEKENYMSAAKMYFEQYCVTQEEAIACSIVDKTFAQALLEEKWFEDYYLVNEQGELVYNEEEAEFKGQVEEYVYNYAVQQFAKSEIYSELTRETDYVLNIQIFISVSTMLVIFYLIIPLALKNGKTLGKLIFKISLANTGGYKVTKIQIILRFTAFYLANFILGLYVSYFLSVFISFTLMVFSKSQSSIHDFCTATIVISDGESIIYKNRDEHLESLKLKESARNKVLFKRQLLKTEDEKKKRINNEKT